MGGSLYACLGVIWCMVVVDGEVGFSLSLSERCDWEGLFGWRSLQHGGMGVAMGG